MKFFFMQDIVNIIKAEGYHMPNVSESDAMFTADRAPDWADGECCHRCRSQFTMIRRKVSLCFGCFIFFSYRLFLYL